jgi:hypothetical protein
MPQIALRKILHQELKLTAQPDCAAVQFRSVRLFFALAQTPSHARLKRKELNKAWGRSLAEKAT